MGSQQRITDASFGELQERFQRITDIPPADQKSVKSDLSIDQLLEFLRSLEAKTKARDLHEIDALAEILTARSAEQVHHIVTKRLTIIYAATTRGWRDAQAFARKEDQLGLPAPIVQPATSRLSSYVRRKPTTKHKKS